MENLQNDFLKELANVGIGHAATALSGMVGSEVNISLPSLTMVPFDDTIIKNNCFSGITSCIEGNVTGALAIVFSDETSFWIIDKMMCNKEGTTKTYDEMGQSAIKEFYNIIGGSFLNALGDMLDVVLMPKVPRIVIGDKSKIIFDITKIVKEEVNSILSVKTDLYIGDKKLEGDLFLIFDRTSFTVISNKLLGVN